MKKPILIFAGFALIMSLLLTFLLFQCEKAVDEIKKNGLGITTRDTVITINNSKPDTIITIKKY